MGIEQRHYIRVSYRQTVSLKTSAGLELLAQTDNISVAGLGIVCDQVTACSIVPGGRYFNLNEAVNITVELCLEGEGALRISCKVHSARRLAEDSYGFNLEITDIKDVDKQLLGGFINQQRC